MTLNNVKNDGNIYCGPAVLSAITGCTTNEAEAMIQRVRHRAGDPRWTKKVTGAYQTELNEALKLKGYWTLDVPALRHGTLFSAMCNMTVGTYIVTVPGHFVCIEVDFDGKRYFLDNKTRKPINAAVAARGGQKVIQVIQVHREVE